MPLKNSIRERRLERGETVRQVADSTGIDPARVSRIERGLVDSTDDQKIAFARHFGCEVSDLFSFDAVVA